MLLFYFVLSHTKLSGIMKLIAHDTHYTHTQRHHSGAMRFSAL